MAAFSGSKGKVSIGGTFLHASRWVITTRISEVDITVANNSGSMDFTSDLPRVDIQLELVYDTVDNPFAPPLKIVPGKKFQNMTIYFDLKAGAMPQMFIDQGLWTGFELTGSVRDAIRFNCSAVCTSLPRLPAPGRVWAYERWNGADTAVVPDNLDTILSANPFLIQNTILSVLPIFGVY